MTLVSVAPNLYVPAVHQPGHEGKTYDWRHPAKSAENTRGVTACVEVLELVDALNRTYRTDALLFTYVLPGYSRQPRVAKDSVGWLASEVSTVPVTTAFFADVDNPGHADWTDEYRAEFERLWLTAPSLQTAGVYHSRRGWRVVQPLERPIPVTESEAYLHRWMRQLDAEGIRLDHACKDWTRYFRMPHVLRDGKPYRSPVVRLERMAPIALDPIDPERIARVVRSTKHNVAPVSIEFAAALPERYLSLVERLAVPVRAVETDRHAMFYALAGALLERQVPSEHVPEVCCAVAAAAGLPDPSKRRSSARDAVMRRAGGGEIPGRRQLGAKWPAVATALDAATATGAAARMYDQAAATSTVAPRSLAETTAALEQAIRIAPDGVTLIAAECGVGKSAAAGRIACERASKLGGESGRAPAQSKTAISVDKNAVAIRTVETLRAQGVAVKRLFGPLSLLRHDGTPECRFHDAALALLQGGQSIQWELCEGRGKDPCEYREVCRAADGIDGPDNARISVGTHGLLSSLSAEAGTTGLLVIDEPPALLETLSFTLDDLEHAEAQLGAFSPRFAAALRPAVVALTSWVRDPAREPTTLPGAIQAAADAMDHTTLVDAITATGIEATDDAAANAIAAVAAALPPDAKTKYPPVKYWEIRRARGNVGAARAIGGASRVLGMIHRVLTSEAHASVRLEDDRMLVTAPREDLVRALRREGSTVVTDANIDLHAPIIERIVEYRPPLHRFAAVDGAPIARTIARCASANRKAWFSHGRIVWSAGVAAALKRALDWAAEDPSVTMLGLITYRLLRLAIENTLRPGDPVLQRAWDDAGQRKSDLLEARNVLAPVLRAFRGRLEVRHYGALRSVNDLADADAIVTLGDPWPNLGSVQHDAAFLELPDWRGRFEALARAELEQAHGRLRTVHRSRPGRALHLGNVVPGGSGWADGRVEIREALVGRPRTETTMTPLEFREIRESLGLSVRTFAAELGCSPGTVSRYERAERTIGGAVAIAVRTMVTPVQTGSAPETGLKGVLATGAHVGVLPKPPVEEASSYRGFWQHGRLDTCVQYDTLSETPTEAEQDELAAWLAEEAS